MVTVNKGKLGWSNKLLLFYEKCGICSVLQWLQENQKWILKIILKNLNHSDKLFMEAAVFNLLQIYTLKCLNITDDVMNKRMLNMHTTYRMAFNVVTSRLFKTLSEMTFDYTATHNLQSCVCQWFLKLFKIKA